MKKKKFMMMVMAAIMLLSVACTASASCQVQKPIKVYYNGLAVDFPDQQPVIINCRTMVPVRAIAEDLDYDVLWIAKDNEVQLYQHLGEGFVFWKIGENTYRTNHDSIVDAGCVPIVLNGCTMVPIRFVAEQLSDLKVEFVQQKYQDVIFLNEKD